jgi:hypothetical protein
MTWEERKEEDRKMWRGIREKNRAEAFVRREEHRMNGDGAMGGRDDRGLDYDDGYEEKHEYEDGRDCDGRNSVTNYNDSRNYEDTSDYDNRNHEASRTHENNSCRTNIQNIPAAYIEDLGAIGDIKNGVDEVMAR